MINFNEPVYLEKSMEYVKKAILINKRLNGDGEFTAKCTEWMEQHFGGAKILLTTSCTHGLEMAALLCDIAPGDEVIMPSYTFVSTANAFVLRGAKIKFVDIDPHTMNINADLIEEAITERTRVIVPVHYAGVGCDMDKIMAVARKHHLIVVEDAAQGVMASIRENISERSEILVPTASTRQRTIRWERAARSISTGRSMWSGERFSGKRERTGQSSSAGKWISIPGWMSDLPTCRVR